MRAKCFCSSLSEEARKGWYRILFVIRHIVRMAYDGEETSDSAPTSPSVVVVVVTPAFLALPSSCLLPRDFGLVVLGTRRKANTGIDPTICAGVATPTCSRRRSQGLILRMRPRPNFYPVYRMFLENCERCVRSVRLILTSRLLVGLIKTDNSNESSNFRWSSVF